MEVMAGRPSLSIKSTHNSVATTLPYVSLPLFIQTNNNTQEEEEEEEEELIHPSTANQKEEEEEEEVSSESSSIGQAGQSSSEEEEVGEVQSKFKKPLIMSLNSIEEALPIKRGLSNYFNGKSKSFACLSDVMMNGRAASDQLVKQENPFNKRRRILMATKNNTTSFFSRRASYNSLNLQSDHHNHLPPLMLCSNFTLDEDKEHDHTTHDIENLPLDQFSSSSSSSLAPLSKLDTKILNKSFKSPRSFSLSDLQHV